MNFLNPNLGSALITSTSVSFIASYACNRNFSRACLSAGLAGVASLIDRVTTALLKKYCFKAEKNLWNRQGQERKLFHIEIPKKFILIILAQNWLFHLAGVPSIKLDIPNSRLAQLSPVLVEAALRFKSVIESPIFMKTITQINAVFLTCLGSIIIKKPVYTFF